MVTFNNFSKNVIFEYRLITVATRHFGNVVAGQIRNYQPDNLPMLMIISRSRGTNEVLDIIQGKKFTILKY